MNTERTHEIRRVRDLARRDANGFTKMGMPELAKPYFSLVRLCNAALKMEKTHND